MASNERIIITGGESSGQPRTMVIHQHSAGQDQLAEVDECFGNARGVNVHLMGKLIGTHPGWRYKASLKDGVAYVIRMHGLTDLPVVWK